MAALTADDGGVLVHCAAGKDRAGWTIATVLRAAGVREEDIIADYLASNDAVAPLRDHLAVVWAPDAAGEPVSLSDAVLGVTEEYYQHGIAVVNELYGSFDGYLDALDLGENAIEMLKSALTDSTD